MNNYMSVGVDASVALQFHLERERNPKKFQSRAGNKSWYGWFGFKETMSASTPLNQAVEVLLDGKPLPLNPTIEGLVVLNIDKYSAGKDLWNTKKASEPDYRTPTSNDGLFEVIGFLGTVHLAKIQTGISNGVRLGQASSIELRITSEIPAQVDGEPFSSPPGTMAVRFHNQSTLLSTKS